MRAAVRVQLVVTKRTIHRSWLGLGLLTLSIACGGCGGKGEIGGTGAAGSGAGGSTGAAGATGGTGTCSSTLAGRVRITEVDVGATYAYNEVDNNGAALGLTVLAISPIPGGG